MNASRKAAEIIVAGFAHTQRNNEDWITEVQRIIEREMRDHWRDAYEDERRANRLLIHTTTESDKKLTALRNAADGMAATVSIVTAIAGTGWGNRDAGITQALDQADKNRAAYTALISEGVGS